MSSPPVPIPSQNPRSLFDLLPAVFRTRDAEQGGALQAYLEVLEHQLELVRENVWQLYDDQFIETCAPWVIPYIGELIGFDPVYTLKASGKDSRAEVANTMGYRRRKGTLLAMEQLTRDVSGRMTVVVEEFKRVATTLSLRNVRAERPATAAVRAITGWPDAGGPFERLNHLVDVRRIAPRSLASANTPDATPLDIALHGGGRFNVPDVAIWMWRYQSWRVEDSPARSIGPGEFSFSTLGSPVALFQQPLDIPQPFTRLMTEADAPQPISRQQFALRLQDFYPSSMSLVGDGVQIPVDQLVCANLSDCAESEPVIPPGKIAIDPEIGRIRLATDVAVPEDLRVTYCYGFPAAIGGGPYNRTANVTLPGEASRFTAVVNTPQYPTLKDALAAWNALAPGSAGVIVLPGYEMIAAELTGADAIQIPAQSELLIVAAEVSQTGAPPQWNRSRPTLTGDVEITGVPAAETDPSAAPPMGHVQFSGILLQGSLRLNGSAVCLDISDCTLVPGRSLDRNGNALQQGEPSLTASAVGSCIAVNRSITGPLALSRGCSARVIGSIVDAGSPNCPAFAGEEPGSPGAVLHIENSTVIGRVWTERMPLATNTIFHARLARHDPWKAAVWAAQRQSGCVRFSWLPFASLVPRRYACLPPDAASEAALLPQFVALRYGRPDYCLLSGRVPLCIWKGADNGSQMGVYQQTQETEAVTNIQIRAAEYLPVNLECGVFLMPYRTCVERAFPTQQYGISPNHLGACDEETQELAGIGIGSFLL